MQPITATAASKLSNDSLRKALDDKVRQCKELNDKHVTDPNTATRINAVQAENELNVLLAERNRRRATSQYGDTNTP